MSSTRDGCFDRLLADLSSQHLITNDQASSSMNLALAPLVGHCSCGKRRCGRVVDEVGRLACNVTGKLVES